MKNPSTKLFHIRYRFTLKFVYRFVDPYNEYEISSCEYLFKCIITDDYIVMQDTYDDIMLRINLNVPVYDYHDIDEPRNLHSCKMKLNNYNIRPKHIIIFILSNLDSVFKLLTKPVIRSINMKFTYIPSDEELDSILNDPKRLKLDIPRHKYHNIYLPGSMSPSDVLKSNVPDFEIIRSQTEDISLFRMF